ncbi:hypothetical protein ACFMBG_19210 [Leisingera sp. D0M16]|uniref:hypothetical protein n=1 Tax=Leisingera coralii TaxID=3351347 RepID=UPI003B7AAC72
MVRHHCSIATLFSLFLGAALPGAATAQSSYEAMRAVFDVCVSNARSGTLMTEQQMLAEVEFDTANQQGLNPQDFSFQVEAGEYFSCVVWTEAAHYNAHEFRSYVDAYVPLISISAKEQNCVWLPVFPKNSCVLPIEKAKHPSGWEYRFKISFEIFAHKYAAMIVRPVLAFDPKGYAHRPNN